MKWFCFFLLGIVGCSSVPVVEAPPWTRGPTRQVDAGYVVYVAKGENASLDHATFQAEAVAIADLANECSFAPKGARIEDRFNELTPEGAHRVWAKVGIVFEECEAAKKAVTPNEIQGLANVGMTEELKRYQDLYYVGDPETEKPEAAALEEPSEYLAARQQMVYAKQVVILSSGPYPTYGIPLAERIRLYEQTHPEEKTASWSTVQAENGARLPPGLRHAGPRAVKSPRTISRPHYSITRPHAPRKRRKMRP